MVSTNNSSRAPEEASLEVWLNSDETAAGSARAWIHGAAEDAFDPRHDSGADARATDPRPADSRLDDAALVVSELVANAVEHGDGGSVRLRLRRRGPSEVELSVFNRLRSGSSGVPEGPWPMPGVEAVRGRGLAVVESLSRRVGVVRGDSDVEVTATVAV